MEERVIREAIREWETVGEQSEQLFLSIPLSHLFSFWAQRLTLNPVYVL